MSTEIQRVKRYRKAYPEDTRDIFMILKELNEIKAAKKRADAWLERNVKGVMIDGK